MLRVNSQVSDLIFSPGRPPQVEIHGQLVSVDASGLRSLTADDTRRIASDLIGNNKQAITMLREQGSCDISFGLPGVARFRVNENIDRKSTRLNSSHSQISYAVFCLKKKKYKDRGTTTTCKSCRVC